MAVPTPHLDFGDFPIRGFAVTSVSPSHLVRRVKLNSSHSMGNLCQSEKSSLINWFFWAVLITVVRYQNNNDIICNLDEFLWTTLTGLVLLPDYCSVHVRTILVHDTFSNRLSFPRDKSLKTSAIYISNCWIQVGCSPNHSANFKGRTRALMCVLQLGRLVRGCYSLRDSFVGSIVQHIITLGAFRALAGVNMHDLPTEKWYSKKWK